MPKVLGLDHLVLVSEDPETLISWYRRHLGAEAERLDRWRAGEVPFASIRLDETTIIDVLRGERTGENMDHLCVVVDELDPEALRAAGVEVLTEPATLWGAQGDGTGVYVRDPAGNTIELRTYEMGE